jgi:hypothetical protein
MLSAYRLTVFVKIWNKPSCGILYFKFVIAYSGLFSLFITRKLLNQEFLIDKLKSSLRKFYGRHHDLVDRYEIYVSQMTTDMIHLS